MGPVYLGKYLTGIGPLLRPPCCICSHPCASMPTERDKQKTPRASSAGKPKILIKVTPSKEGGLIEDL